MCHHCHPLPPNIRAHALSHINGQITQLLNMYVTCFLIRTPVVGNRSLQRHEQTHVPSTTHRQLTRSPHRSECGPCVLGSVSLNVNMIDSMIDTLGSYMIGSTSRFFKLLPTARLHLRRDLSRETSKNKYPVSIRSSLGTGNGFRCAAVLLTYELKASCPSSAAVALKEAKAVHGGLSAP